MAPKWNSPLPSEYICPKCHRSFALASALELNEHRKGCGLKPRALKSYWSHQFQDSIIVNQTPIRSVTPRVSATRSTVPPLPKGAKRQKYTHDFVQWLKKENAYKDGVISRLNKELHDLRLKYKRDIGRADSGPAEGFYTTRAWKQLRFEVLKSSLRKCALCHRTDRELHVDHIIPRSKAPELSLEPSNLQVLCADCNLGKGNRDNTDFRLPNTGSGRSVSFPPGDRGEDD